MGQFQLVRAVTGDGTCERIYNTEEFNYDGGYCIEFNELHPSCEARDPWRVGDGYCNRWGGMNTDLCKINGGGCVPPPEYPD